jgi:E3 SUMO-protein ligase PIAS1
VFIYFFLTGIHVAVDYLIGSYEPLANCQLLPSVFRKMQDPASTVAASRSLIESGHSVKPKKKTDNSVELNAKVRCPCGNSKPNDPMIKV